MFLGPRLERARVLGRQQITGDTVAIGHDQGEIRLPDDVRSDEHMAEQVGVLEERSCVPARVAGLETDSVHARKIVERGRADRAHGHYPGREQVAEWLSAEGLVVVAEGSDWEDDWGYWHLLLRSVTDA